MKTARFSQIVAAMFVVGTLARAMPARSDEPAGKDSLQQATDASKTLPPATAGGTTQRVRAVPLALAWLAKHQTDDGSWRFDPPAGAAKGYANPGTWKSDAGATALALLPFLAAGQTHKTKGPYQQTITSSLLRLTKRQPRNGDLSAGGSPKMFSHGLAAAAICEAYCRTGDDTLRVSAYKAIKFIVASQDGKSGGWAETPGKPSMSASAWQIMALVSADAAGVEVPASALKKAALFLDSVQAEGGVKYGETNGKDASDTATSIGLFTRVYVGPKARATRDAPGQVGGLEFLTRRGPAKNDAVYTFWATMFVHSNPGAEWDVWNRKMRRQIIDSQVHEGDETGSWWNPNDLNAAAGGRLLQTAFTALTLEVYYQYWSFNRWIYKVSPEDK